VQRGGLARSGRPAHEEKAVRLVDHGFQVGDIAFRQRQFFERQRLARSQHPHHHIFEPACGRHGRHAQFDVQIGHELLHLDLAVLRLAPLSNIEIAHDLDARDQRITPAGRHFAVIDQIAVAAKTDAGFFDAGIGFDVDVRRAAAPGIDNDLVHQFDEFIVLRSRNLIRAELVLFVLKAFGRPHIREQRINLPAFAQIEKSFQRFLEIVARGDPQQQLFAGINLRGGMTAAQHFWIARHQHNAVGRFIDRQPAAFAHIVEFEIAQQIERFGAFGAMRLVGNAKEMRKRFADLRHADAITFQEYVFRIAV